MPPAWVYAGASRRWVLTGFARQSVIHSYKIVTHSQIGFDVIQNIGWEQHA
jgi:hypothetical protein